MDKLIDNILLLSNPNDLLSLYLTDNKIKKRLGNKVILGQLNKKFNTNGKSFIAIYKEINIKLLTNERTLYLYNLENLYYTPLKPSIDEEKRYSIVLWLYNTKLTTDLAFGLAVTLMDYYGIYSNEVACVCLYIAAYHLHEYNDMTLYNKKVKLTKKKFQQLELDIVTKLQGIMIRATTSLFTTQPMAIISYFSKELLLYRPSLIAETMNYLITGNYKLYTLSEMAGPCRFIHSIIEKLKTTSLKKYIVPIKKICEKENKIIQRLTLKPPVKWHLKDFKVLNTIGAGEQGKIYKLQHVNTQLYALKTMKNAIENTVIEIASLKTLQNSIYIISLLEFNLTIKKSNLYLEYGQYSLTKGIQDKLIKNPSKYFTQLIKAVNYCHFNDIIHRDLKTDNVVFNGKNLMLIDLGLSVSYASHRDYLDPDLAGTPLFRAPECFLGDTKYNYKIDVWSLGVIFYFMITGEYLFDDGDDILENIFYYLGTPTNNTWKNVTKLPRWEKHKKQVAQTAFLKKKMGKHYPLISKCLVLDPKKRADTHTLLMM